MDGNADSEQTIRKSGLHLSPTRNTEGRLSDEGFVEERDIVPKTVEANNKNFSRHVAMPLLDTHPATRKNVAIVTGGVSSSPSVNVDPGGR